MLEKLLKRLTEPSTWAGVAALAYGAGQVGQINEAAQVAEVAGHAAEVAAGGGGWLGAVIAFGAGLGAMFMPEGGKAK